MHVPDGVLPFWVYVLFLIISLPILGFAVYKVNKLFDDRLTPYMGVLAAVIFAAQFVNFQVPPSSGHLVGTTLLAVMLGPWAAMVIMALVLFVQALYGDGGLLAFGLNFFNMSVLGAIFGWGIAYVLFKGLIRIRDENFSVLVATTIAAFVTVVLSAFVLGLELLSIPGLGFEFVYVITGIHGLIAIGEAVLTFVILLYFVKAAPNMISFLKDSDTGKAIRRRKPSELAPIVEEGI